MGARAGSSMEKATKNKGHLSSASQREKPSLTFEQVSQYFCFCMPIKQAAEELKIGQTTLKKRCRKLGISRWPGRNVKSMQTLMDYVQELGKDGPPGRSEKTQMAVEKLQQCKKLMEETPGAELDNETLAFRQVVYKEICIRRSEGVKLAVPKK